jgi:phosphopantetheine--protein transferase-like protein
MAKVDVLPISLGIDIVNIPRFRKLICEENFKRTLFSDRESHMADESLAGNFAIKESFIKAFRGNLLNFDFPELEVLRDKSGAPFLFTRKKSLVSHVDKVLSISISHDVEYCVGVVIAQIKSHNA